MINVESQEEFKALEQTAARLRKRARFSIRINPGIDAHTHDYITTGRLGTKFGVQADEALKIYAAAKRSKWLEIKGIHAHLGSQISSAEPYIKGMHALLKIAERLKKTGIKLEYVDIGGGWAVDEDCRQKPLSELAQALIPMLREQNGLKLIIEPGRSLVAGAGMLLTKVLYRKTSAGKKFLIVDAAMNDLVRPALYGAKHPVAALFPGKGRVSKFDIVGPVCESGDFLAKDAVMPLPEQGDVLAVLCAGAYGFSMSSQYNSRLRPAEVLVSDSGKAWKIIRARETFSDLVRLERRR